MGKRGARDRESDTDDGGDEGEVMSQNTSTSIVPVSSLLGIVFVTLKLCGVIAWSWWWVTCPFWIGLAMVLAFMAFALAMAGIATVIAFITTREK